MRIELTFITEDIKEDVRFTVGFNAQFTPEVATLINKKITDSPIEFFNSLKIAIARVCLEEAKKEKDTNENGK